MSKISRIRILNLNYNNNTIRIDDETFDLGGQNTLLSLRNGGGKSVLVQMIISLFVNRTYRDFGDRPFKSYFTTNRPTFLMTEWQLDNGRDRFLAGMMVRKNQKEDHDTEELEMYTFTGSYVQACAYDLDNFPVIRREGNKKILKGFSECRNLLEEISTGGAGDFRLYDMTSQYGRRQYFATLRQYQINNKEWESIIRKVNQKESGLSELFQNARDEKDLVENWFLRPIEDKLNQERNRIDEFRKLAFQFIEQYRSNQSKIQRKGIIEQYFEDTKPLKQQIDGYISKEQEASLLKTEMIVYARALQKEIVRLAEEILVVREKLAHLQKEQEQIVYEQLSYQIYGVEDQKAELVTRRVEQEQEVIRLAGVKADFQRRMTVCDLGRLYQELQDFQNWKAEVDEKIHVLLQETEDSKEEIDKIGCQLYQWYFGEAQRFQAEKAAQEEACRKTTEEMQEAEDEQKRNEQQIYKISGEIGGLRSRIEGYDGAEESFNKEFGMDIRRNILGFYEDGFLDIQKKDMAAGLQEQKNQLARTGRKQNDLENSLERLLQENSEKQLKIRDCIHEMMQLRKNLEDLDQQKNSRLLIMKYIGIKEDCVDQKGLILYQLDGRIRQLDLERNDLLQNISRQEKQFWQMKEGKTAELPDNVRNDLEQKGLDIVYGMEWLARNGRTVRENTELVRKNPFLPYAILMERNVFAQFRKNEEALYTSFPIPIIIKEELEETLGDTDGKFAVYGNVHFYVMFNEHLLDPAELEKMLHEIRQKIQGLQKRVADKEADLRAYRDYRVQIAQQTFTREYYQKTEKELAAQTEQKEQLEQRLLEIRRERTDREAEKRQTEKRLEKIKSDIFRLELREQQFVKLCRSYAQYVTDRTSFDRLAKEQEDLAARQKLLGNLLDELLEQKAGINSQIREYLAKIKAVQEKTAEFQSYREIARAGVSEQTVEWDASRLEARYRALTEDISKNIEELKEEQIRLQDSIDKKQTDLKRRNEGDGIAVSEYEHLVYSEEQYESWKKQLKQAEKAYNQASDAQVQLERQMEACTTKIELYTEQLKNQTGFEQPVPRERIVDTEFEKRLRLKKYARGEKQKELDALEDRNTKLSAQAAAVEEYAEEPLPMESAEAQKNIPDVKEEEMDVIRSYQKDKNRKIREISRALEDCRIRLGEVIREIASRKSYADDYFRKTFESLLSQTGHPHNLARQFEMNRQAYENQLEKLKIDLAHIDDEQKNLEMMFLEYVEQISANIGMIDRNSTITVRGRSLKMLRIHIPDWETEKEHFRLKLHDYFETVIKMGIETIEKNGNLTEFLGRVITTRKLYDDIVGIQNVKIKLYKIEAEREVPISWSEVSANSGGEGFLSAFVILTCLLSYMRRDEADLFSSGEEGKVLIMDNPFAQTNAEHLLKPLMEMAKKTNTQLICLSGLGGDSIYNRFDNIYVLKLVESSIRNGVQRMEVQHRKGEDIKRMVLSEFKMEQISLFDLMEE